MTKKKATASKPTLSGQGREDKGTEADGGATDKEKGSDSSLATGLAWVALVTVLLVGLLTSPYWFWVLVHWGDSRTPEPVGTIQRIEFIGNLSIHSQIDTEQRSFMVRGITRLQKGHRIELRKTLLRVQLCVIDSSQCEELMGHV